MLDGVLEWGQLFMEHYGLWAIFILMFLETALILHGVPTEFIMTLGALSIMHTPGDLAAVVIVGTLGATLGSQAVYWAAYYGGRPFILRHPRLFRMTEERLDRFDRTFASSTGAVLVFACRLVPFLRGFVSIPAGLARMPAWPYFGLSTLGALCFNLVLSGTTYLTHRVPDSPPAVFFRHAADYVASHALWLAAVLSVVLALSILAWWKRAHVAPHYQRHMPAGWSGLFVAAFLVGLVMSAILVAVPAVFRGLRTSGTPLVAPLVVMLGLLALAAFLAAHRHKAASVLARMGRRRPPTDGGPPTVPGGGVQK